MEMGSICQITALTRVLPEGQKCVAAILRYDRPLAPGADLTGCFSVEGRRILEARPEGDRAVLELDPADAGAATYFPGDPWQGVPARLEPPVLALRQLRPVPADDGTLLPPFDRRLSDRVENELADDFIQGEEEGLRYSLFIPRGYDPARRYPLVQFIHDAAVCGSDPRLTLAQGLGAVVWASEEEQRKHPCFVFAPQFDGAPIVDDAWNVSPRLETLKRVLDGIRRRFSIDPDRVYTTGQSMGCMASIVWNLRYPDDFAASFLVAGQWDERGIDGLEKQRLWMLNSQGDAKSFPGMNQMCVAMEQKGARVAHRVVDAGLTQPEFTRIVRELEQTGANVLCTHFRLETVADGWHSNGGAHHVHTWRTAYQIEAIRDWLFSVKKGEICDCN